MIKKQGPLCGRCLRRLLPRWMMHQQTIGLPRHCQGGLKTLTLMFLTVWETAPCTTTSRLLIEVGFFQHIRNSCPHCIMLKHYCLATQVFGFTMKVIETTDAKINRCVDGKLNETTTDMLFGERLGIILYGAITGPFVVPLKSLHWLNMIDIHLRGQSPSEYGMKCKTVLVDYLF